MKKRGAEQHIERRAFPLTEVRIDRRQGEPVRLTGHAAVFNKLSEELWGFRERIKPGAFAKTLGNDVRALWNHDANHVLGRTTAKTLTLREDEVGLAVEILLPDTQTGRDLAVSIERGDVSQMSFAFRTITDRWNTENGETIRTLEEVELFDVSPVTFPAYPDTDVAVRSLERWKAQRKTEERPETVEPMDDGMCPEGYTMGDDGMCHLMSEESAWRRDPATLRRRMRQIAVETGA